MTGSRVTPGDDSPRRGRLALAYQEVFTTVARLRANKQVATDAGAFRERIKQVLASAQEDATANGYSVEYVRYAAFAVITLLDETVLSSGQPMFATWASQTLQEESFGRNVGGDLFYQFLQQLLGQQDSPDLADVLEVYSLCLLLGFKGRLGSNLGTDVAVLVRQLSEKMDRARGPAGELSPRWKPSSAEIGRRRDPWVKRLGIAAGILVVVAVGLFITFTISLHAGAGDLVDQTARMSK